MGEPVAGGAARNEFDLDAQITPSREVADAAVDLAELRGRAGRRGDFAGGATAVVRGQAAKIDRRIACDATRGGNGRVVRTDGWTGRVGRVDRVAQRLAGRVVRCQCTRGELGIGVGAQARPAGVSGLRRRIRVAGHDRRGAGGVDQSPDHRVGGRAGGHALFMRLGEDLDPREQERGDHQPHDEASELHGPTFFSVASTTPASRLNDGAARLKYSSA